MKLSQILSAVGLAPKDLEQARNTIEPAKAALEQVNALFTNAGLNLEAMLETGPDALKAHIESLGNSDEELANALLEVESLTAKAEKAEGKAVAIEAAVASTGLNLAGVEDAKGAFADHVRKAAVVELAKAGHPPVAVVNVDQKTATQEDIFATYKAMPPGDERLAFYAKHETAIRRAAGFKD